MSPQSLQTVKASLHALPVAMIFSKQLLLIRSAPEQSASPAGERETESLTIRATKLTGILKGIQGYNHGGLNE
jgi:hypothetical protein